MPLQIAPSSLLPESTPDWASAAEARNFIDVPFDGFLAPPSKLVRSTRILYHYFILKVISYKLTNLTKIIYFYLYLYQIITYHNLIIKPTGKPLGYLIVLLQRPRREYGPLAPSIFSLLAFSPFFYGYLRSFD